MRSYTIPETAGLTVAEAEAALERLWAAVLADPGHPYTNEHHPHHRCFVAAVHRLYELRAKNPPPAPVLPLTAQEQGEIQAEITRLQGTPGFFSGALRRESLKAHDRLVGKIHELFAALAEGRAAAEAAVAAAAEAERPDAEEVADDELAQAAERVQRAEQDAAEAAVEDQVEGEADDADELL